MKNGQLAVLVIFVIFAFVTESITAYAQEVLMTIDVRMPALANFSDYQDLSRVGDINNDGHQDIIISSQDRSGRDIFTVISGRDGSTFEILAPSSASYSNCPLHRFAVGDVNGDGHADIAYYATYSRIDVISGKSHQVFRQIPINGYPVCNHRIIDIGDLNGDGYGEIVTFYIQDYLPALKVFNGNDGQSHCSNVGSFNDSVQSVLVAEDTNEDGYRDILLADPRMMQYSTKSGGIIKVSGKNCEEIGVLLGEARQYLGEHLIPFNMFINEANTAYLALSADNMIIDRQIKPIQHAHEAINMVARSYMIASLSDLNFDDYNDYAILSTKYNDPESIDNERLGLSIHSGKTGAPIGRISPSFLSNAITGEWHNAYSDGLYLVENPDIDLDGDGIPDIVLASRNFKKIIIISAACPTQARQTVFPEDGMLVPIGTNLIESSVTVCGLRKEGYHELSYKDQSYSMNDLGQDGDLKAGDTIYSCRGDFPLGLNRLGIWSEVNNEGSIFSYREIDLVAFPNYQVTVQDYQWVEPNAADGVQLIPQGDGASLRLPFSFNFYGSDYDTIYVHKDGLLSFEDTLAPYSPERLPSRKLDHAYLAPLWSNLADHNMSKIYTTSTGTFGDRRHAITWENFRYRSDYGLPPDSGRLDFQVVLYERNSEIVFNYKILNSSYYYKAAGAGATIGLQANGALGLTVSHMQSYFSDQSSIRFVPGYYLDDDKDKNDNEPTDDDTDDNSDSTDNKPIDQTQSENQPQIQKEITVRTTIKFNPRQERVRLNSSASFVASGETATSIFIETDCHYQVNAFEALQRKGLGNWRQIGEFTPITNSGALTVIANNMPAIRQLPRKQSRRQKTAFISTRLICNGQERATSNTVRIKPKTNGSNLVSPKAWVRKFQKELRRAKTLQLPQGRSSNKATIGKTLSSEKSPLN